MAFYHIAFICVLRFCLSLHTSFAAAVRMVSFRIIDPSFMIVSVMRSDLLTLPSSTGFACLHHRGSLSLTAFLYLLHLAPSFMWGCLHVARSYTSSAESLLFDITPHSVQPSSLRPSSPPSPLYSDFHRRPSYVVLLSLHHMPMPLQPPFQNDDGVMFSVLLCVV